MSTDANLPSDVSEQAIDPVVCEQCQIIENRIEDLQDALSDALEFLVDLEMESRAHQFGPIGKQEYRNALLSCIERVKKLA